MQGLWAAMWLCDVEGLPQDSAIHHLLVMAISVCVTALLLGVGADRLRKRISPHSLLLMVVLTFIAAQLAVIMRWPIPSYLSWAIIAGVGAATVLSFAIIAETFPAEIAGQANAALNVVHVTGGFLLQYLPGVIIHLWPNQNAHYPLQAYQTAFGIFLVVQVFMLLWYMAPRRAETNGHDRDDSSIDSVENELRLTQLRAARKSTRRWKAVTAAGCLLCGFVGSLAVTTSGNASAHVQHAELSHRHAARSVAVPIPIGNAQSDALIKYLLARFVADIRSVSTDAVVDHDRWVEAYEFASDRAARSLHDELKRSDLTRSVERPTIVQVDSIERISQNSFGVRWTETSYDRDRVTRASFSGRATVFLASGAVRRAKPFSMEMATFEWTEKGVRP
jgi:type IV secretory pathway TrbF-like protein